MKKLIAVLILLLIVAINQYAYSQHFRFAVMTDSRGDYNGVNEPVLRKIADHIIKNHPDIKFIIFPGDLVTGSKYDTASTASGYQFWREIMGRFYSNPDMFGAKVYVTVGNHEIQNRFDEDIFRRSFPEMPQNGPDDEKGITYSFEFGKVHFTVVNTNRWYYGNPADTSDDRRDWHYVKHLDWIRNDLQKAKQNGAEWLFVLGHDPVFPVGGHLRDCLPNLGKDVKLPLDSVRLFNFNRRNDFWNLMLNEKVSAYICGHEHLYGRQSVDDMFHLTLGSAGAPLYRLNPVYNQSEETNKALSVEFSYDEALPYYKILNYNYGPDGNGQASKDFIGFSAFNYGLFDVEDDIINVTVYGAFPDEGTNDKLSGDLNILDSFVLKKKTEK